MAYSAETYAKNAPGYCDIAIEYYRKYLEINPNASDKKAIEDKIYEVEAKKEVYQKRQIKELEKYVGTWDVYLWHEDKIDSYELFLTGGKLMTRVPLSYEYWADKHGETIDSQTKKAYQNVPVSVSQNFIQFSYTNTKIFHGGTESPNHKSILTNNYSYQLNLVDKNKLEGYDDWQCIREYNYSNLKPFKSERIKVYFERK